MYGTQDSQGQLLALALGYKSLARCELSPLRSESVRHVRDSVGAGVHSSNKSCVESTASERLQGYLIYKKTHPPS